MSARWVKTIRFVAWAVVLFIILKVATFDYPLMSGSVMIEAPNADRTGIRGVYPTVPGLIFEGVLFVASVVALVWTWRKSHGEPSTAPS